MDRNDFVLRNVETVLFDSLLKGLCGREVAISREPWGPMCLLISCCSVYPVNLLVHVVWILVQCRE